MCSTRALLLSRKSLDGDLDWLWCVVMISECKPVWLGTEPPTARLPGSDLACALLRFLMSSSTLALPDHEMYRYDMQYPHCELCVVEV